MLTSSRTIQVSHCLSPVSRAARLSGMVRIIDLPNSLDIYVVWCNLAITILFICVCHLRNDFISLHRLPDITRTPHSRPTWPRSGRSPRQTDTPLTRAPCWRKNPLASTTCRILEFLLSSWLSRIYIYWNLPLLLRFFYYTMDHPTVVIWQGQIC